MGKKTIPIITEGQFRILEKIKDDIFTFAPYIHVIHPIRGKVRFDLYPFQKKVLWYFLTKRFNIILKFRQAGITELICLYCLWLAMFHPNKNIQIISLKDRVAKRVLRKIKYMYKNLPDFLQVPIVNGRMGDYGTVQEMEWDNGSIITSIPTTEDAGRSEATSLLIIDEAAMVRWANIIWGAAFPSLSTGGSAIVNSTPYGIGNWFHKTYVEACAGGNPFNPIRLKWDMHPERDIQWYLEMKAALGPRRTAQEIDGDFLSSGDTVFDLMDIKAIEDEISEFTVLERRYNGSLIIYDVPKKGMVYTIGADVATGRAKDFSTFTIMDRYGEEAAVFKGKISTPKFKNLLGEMGKRYNWAKIACEANDIGEGVVMGLQEDKYPNLYYTKRFLKEKKEAKAKEEKVPGWYTTTKNRRIIIDELENDIRLDNVIIKDPFFVQEAYTFIYDEQNKPIALGKENRNKDAVDMEETYNDDSIMAKAICNFVRKGKINTTVVAPQ